MESTLGETVRVQMDELRLKCAGEIPIMQRRFVSVSASYRKFIDSTKSRAKEPIQLQDSVQESLNQWLSKTQNFLLDDTSSLVKAVNDRRSSSQDHTQDVDAIFMSEQTVDWHTPRGSLSRVDILSIE